VAPMGRPEKRRLPVPVFCVDIGALFDEQLDHLSMAILGRNMKRCPVAFRSFGVDNSAIFDEEVYDLMAAQGGRNV